MPAPNSRSCATTMSVRRTVQSSRWWRPSVGRGAWLRSALSVSASSGASLSVAGGRRTCTLTKRSPLADGSACRGSPYPTTLKSDSGWTVMPCEGVSMSCSPPSVRTGPNSSPSSAFSRGTKMSVARSSPEERNRLWGSRTRTTWTSPGTYPAPSSPSHSNTNWVPARIPGTTTIASEQRSGRRWPSSFIAFRSYSNIASWPRRRSSMETPSSTRSSRCFIRVWKISP
mmetsp:Transcript_9330/g.22879  ORF Transcript_9330/g.22879 Transcript_9330/m.22879 type:complete len:228 (+) Transcript_9330:190-873(+)